jgi:hypothetical protein
MISKTMNITIYLGEDEIGSGTITYDDCVDPYSPEKTSNISIDIVLENTVIGHGDISYCDKCYDVYRGKRYISVSGEVVIT